jgi:hypothetical protein
MRLPRDKRQMLIGTEQVRPLQRCTVGHISDSSTRQRWGAEGSHETCSMLLDAVACDGGRPTGCGKVLHLRQGGMR